MNEDLARKEICRVGQSLFERGYVHSTAGNISVRLADGFLITPTDACLGFLAPHDIAKVDAEGRLVGGPPASKTLLLHRAIYAATGRHGQPAGCVLHTHSTSCVAASLNAAPGELLPPITPYFVMKVGHVPLLPYRRPGDPEVAQWVTAAIDRYAAAGTPLRAVMLARLGPNVWGGTPGQAMAVLEELEETAKLWLACAGAVQPLDEDALRELRESFGARW